MAEENSGQEKTEQPTQKKIQDSRDKGEIARSRELTTMAVLMASSTTLLMYGDTLARGLGKLMRSGLTLDRSQIFDVTALTSVLQQSIFNAIYVLVPFFLVVVAAAIVAPMALGGWSFSPDSIALNLEKLDPIKGIKKIFAWRGLMELAKALGKFLVVGIFTLIFLWNTGDQYLSLSNQPIEKALAHTTTLLAWSFLVLSSSLIIIALIDIPFQLWDHTQKLKMSLQEVKDELKQTEGNPELKARVRNIQREMAERRMMQEVPKADVIVTNPTHFATALHYDQKNMGAPVLIAKGSELIATEIRNIASRHNIPVVRSPVLARALYFNVRLNEQIPAGLYMAVAEVLAYVMQLKKKGSQPESEPIDMENVQVPEEMTVRKKPGTNRKQGS